MFTCCDTMSSTVIYMYDTEGADAVTYMYNAEGKMQNLHVRYGRTGAAWVKKQMRKPMS